MAYRVTSPLPPRTLDAVLAEGWYRSGQHVFTTNWLVLDEGAIVSPVLWARVDLSRWTPPRRYRRLLAAARRFTVALEAQAAITPELEALYAQYLVHTRLDSGPTVAAVLLDGALTNQFPTRLLTVRDGGVLIAAGFLDEGAETTAGILNFYHPDYRQYSLGLLLYFTEMAWSHAAGKRWYYPGYIATHYPKFDYKLLAGAASVETRDPETGRWMPYAESEHARIHGH